MRVVKNTDFIKYINPFIEQVVFSTAAAAIITFHVNSFFNIAFKTKILNKQPKPDGIFFQFFLLLLLLLFASKIIFTSKFLGWMGGVCVCAFILFACNTTFSLREREKALSLTKIDICGLF